MLALGAEVVVISLSISANARRKLQHVGKSFVGALLTGVLLAGAQVQMDSEWPWIFLAAAWVPLFAVLPNRAWACWLLASLVHMIMMVPLIAGVASAVGLALGLPVMYIVAGLSSLPFFLHPWAVRRWGAGYAHLFVLGLMVAIDAGRMRSVVNWVGMGDALGESTAVAPVLYVLGLSGCLLLLGGINALWLLVVRQRAFLHRGLTCLVAGGLTFCPILWSTAMEGSLTQVSGSISPWRVALVAPGLEPDEADGDPLKVDRLMAAYRQLNSAEVDVVLMPQSSLNGLSPSEPDLRKELFSIVAQQGIALLAGSEQRMPDHRWDRPHQYNAAFLINPQAAHAALVLGLDTHAPAPFAVQWQAKRHPVPWTEVWPDALRQLPLGGLEQRVAPYVSGEHSQPLSLDFGKAGKSLLGVMLCYDAYAPHIADQLREQGSQMLVVLSSDESFSGSALSRQGLRMARLRGMSLGLPVIRVAWSQAGTGAYDAHGRRLTPQPLRQPVPGVTLWHVPRAPHIS